MGGSVFAQTENPDGDVGDGGSPTEISCTTTYDATCGHPATTNAKTRNRY
ncbi:326_t:CDS:2 [Ambispora gerdemannii]|uniref:326_t:CDS:1 n=1 Tax=Ambispora gerdemannii TaxID=144530 RepID=A0A9N9AHS8_9GLOM|nr:326_t:CDS:2 [Ambispora gerdemannii]